MEHERPMLLAEIVPSFADELEQLLKKEGEVKLAAQVPQLSIVDRCRCGNDFCASFYTQRKPEGAYGPGHDSIELEPAAGMLILDVVAHTIVHVELLYRNDIREKLLAALP